MVTKYMFHTIMNSEYLGIVTLLDYEMRTCAYLSEIVFPSDGKKMLVDMALKVGMNQYRFVEFEVDRQGKIKLTTNSYVDVSKEIEQIANGFLRENRDIVLNSFLPEIKKKELLCV